jgi:hypothetical protein
VVLSFDSPINDGKTALYPAEVTALSLAKNTWNDPQNIVKERGELNYSTSFTFYTGDPLLTGRVRSNFTATISKTGASTRDLILNGEIAITASYNIYGTLIYYNHIDGFYVDINGFAPLDKKALYLLNDQLYIVNSDGYTEPENAITLFYDDLLIVPAHQSIPITLNVFLVYPAGLLASDLNDTTIKINLELSLPDYMGD